MLLFEDRESIVRTCLLHGIDNYTINQDSTVDVERGVYLADRQLTDLPLNFGKVIGNFHCGHNQLTSLEGSPKIVDGSFFCTDNKLTDLEGSPEDVSLQFDCSNNELTTLKGSPKIATDFNCRKNKLTSLEFGPEKVYMDYNCTYNTIENFKGFDTIFGGDFFTNMPFLNQKNYEYVNTFANCNIINGYEIRLKRLKYFCNVMGLKMFTLDDNKFERYSIV